MENIDGIEWPEYIKRAVKCGTLPPMRTDDQIIEAALAGGHVTDGERVVLFAHQYLRTPEGVHVGKPLRLSLFQRAFIIAIFDNPHGTRKAILSVARRNGKTAIVGVILLAFLVGPLAVKNSQLASAAMSRDQAALVFRLMVKMLMQSPELEGTYRVVPSSKRIIGVAKNVEFEAMSSDSKTGHGRSLLVVILDESGQIIGPHNDFVAMLQSSQGSYENALFLTISTQAPSDADLLSIWIDDALRSGDPSIVCHVYEAAPGCALTDKSQWHAANPGLGDFRSMGDLEAQILTADRLPVQEASVRNLLLNQRVAKEGLWISPSRWKACSGEPDLEVFRRNPVALGLDLSARVDLSAAVLAARDEQGYVHLLPFIFTPSSGLKERGQQNRAPFELWVEQGYLITVPGSTISYDWVCEYMRDKVIELGLNVDILAFDRWRIKEFRLAAERADFAQGANWIEVGQGYKDQGPRLEAFENEILDGKIRHGNHPLLNFAAASAIVVKDPAGNLKIDKARVAGAGKIDALVASVMAAHPVTEGRDGAFSIGSMIA